MKNQEMELSLNIVEEGIDLLFLELHMEKGQCLGQSAIDFLERLCNFLNFQHLIN